MRAKIKKMLIIGAGLFFILAMSFLAFVIFVFRPYTQDGAIPQGWGYSQVPRFEGSVAIPAPLQSHGVPTHPYLAKTNASNMHVDSYATDVHPAGGPLGQNPKVRSYSHGSFGGECASVTFDSIGNLVAVCATFKKFSLLLISPETLRPLAQYDLPPRASNKTFNLRKIMSDTSGGAYFYLDSQDRAILVDAEQRLLVIGQASIGGSPTFILEKSLPLKPHLVKTNDVITSVLPDYQGKVWFVSRLGVVGVIDLEADEVSTMTLDGEEIQNSFAVDQHGAYVVSDFALYLLRASISGEVLVEWRQEYERASQQKLGSITLGSGTTPTLVGSRWVAITDNASPRINVVVYERAPGYKGVRLLCAEPVFLEHQSATENTLIGTQDSVIVENNHGYDLFPTMMFGKRATGGVTRIDIDESGCTTRWESSEVSQTTVPKLSAETGLVYLYTKESAQNWIDAFYLTALDFDSGQTVFKQLVGTGVSYDNNWAPITLAPSQCAYVGVLRGLVEICDQKED